MAFGTLRADRSVNAAEAGLRILLIQAARLARAVEAQKGVMDDAPVAGMKFHAANVTSRGHRERDDKIPIHISSLWSQRVSLGHLHHQIRRAQLPALRELW